MQPGVTLCLRLRSGAILEALRAIGSDIERAEELAASRLGIKLTDFRCLEVLARGERMTAGQLADEASLTTGVATSRARRSFSIAIP